jgi:TetR/AcrR family transcriptional regulator, mexJK operon transcriptional repressor
VTAVTTIATHEPGVTAGSLREVATINRILEGAGRVFLRDGLGGSSVDDIAREAAVSKATLYRHFDDKNALFIAWLLRQVARATRHIEATDVGPGQPLSKVLTDLAKRFLHVMIDEDSRALFRTAIAEATRLPSVGTAFHAAIVGTGHCRVVEALDQAVAIGDIRPVDTALAAHQFMALCRAENFLDSMLLQTFTLDDATVERQAETAVRFFLAGLRS